MPPGWRRDFPVDDCLGEERGLALSLSVYVAWFVLGWFVPVQGEIVLPGWRRDFPVDDCLGEERGLALSLPVYVAWFVLG